MSTASDTWGSTLFCDDIRFEVDGKFSVIGIYRGEMLIAAEAFPLTLPKLGVVVQYKERMGARDGDIKAKIYFPGDEDARPAYEFLVPGGSRTNAPSFASSTEPDGQVLEMILPILIGPAFIKEAGRIKVRVESAGQVAKLGTLSVKLAESARP